MEQPNSKESKNYSSTTSISQTGAPVTVEASHSHSGVLANEESTTHTVFTVKTGEPEPEKQESAPPPIELCLVLDRSGSMRGDRLEFSKKAIEDVINSLTVKDKCHFITYDNGVQQVFVNGDLRSKDALIKKVRAVQTGGSTNISNALIAAARELGLHGQGQFFKTGAPSRVMQSASATVKCGECKADNLTGFKFCQNCGKPPPASLIEDASQEQQRTKRIFLWSDGAANQGLKSVSDLSCLAEEICGAGACITTFGLGKDFNEDVMTGIAKNGQGSFFFIESSKRIGEICADALGGLKTLVGTEAKLTLTGVNGVEVEKIYDQKGNVHQLRDIRFSNEVQSVVKLKVAKQEEKKKEEEWVILKWVLSYTDARSGEMVTLEGHVTHSIVASKESIVEDADTTSIVMALQASEMDAEVIKHLDQGDREAAMRTKKAQVAKMKQAATMSPSNRNAQVMWSAGEANVKLMEREKDVRRVRKANQYEGYLRRKNSISSINQLAQQETYMNDATEPDGPKSRSRTPSPTKRVSPSSRRRNSVERRDAPPSRPAGDAPQQAPSLSSKIGSFLGGVFGNDDN